MTITKMYCDRCGKEVEYHRDCRGQRIFRLKEAGGECLDICQSCYDSLAEWMELGKTESEEEHDA